MSHLTAVFICFVRYNCNDNFSSNLSRHFLVSQSFRIWVNAHTSSSSTMMKFCPWKRRLQKIGPNSRPSPKKCLITKAAKMGFVVASKKNSTFWRFGSNFLRSGASVFLPHSCRIISLSLLPHSLFISLSCVFSASLWQMSCKFEEYSFDNW